MVKADCGHTIVVVKVILSFSLCNPCLALLSNSEFLSEGTEVGDLEQP